MVDLKNILAIIAKSIVDRPEDVAVIETVEGNDIILELSVAADDMGKVIGKDGRIAKAIRTIVKAAGGKEGVKYSVVILEADEE